MSLTRRNFLIRGSLSLAAGALSPVLVEGNPGKTLRPIYLRYLSLRKQK